MLLRNSLTKEIGHKVWPWISSCLLWNREKPRKASLSERHCRNYMGGEENILNEFYLFAATTNISAVSAQDKRHLSEGLKELEGERKDKVSDVICIEDWQQVPRISSGWQQLQAPRSWPSLNILWTHQVFLSGERVVGEQVGSAVLTCTYLHLLCTLMEGCSCCIECCFREKNARG